MSGPRLQVAVRLVDGWIGRTGTVRLQLDGEQRGGVGVAGPNQPGDLAIVFNIGQVRGADGRSFRLKSLVEKRRVWTRASHGMAPGLFTGPWNTRSTTPAAITMPPRNSIRSRSGREQATVDYYATLLHELVHWTGHESRLARPFGYSDDDDRYRFEEMVAELGSGFLCARFGLGNARPLTAGRRGVAAYINGYFEARRDPVDLVIDAAGEANRASNYLIYGKRQQP